MDAEERVDAASFVRSIMFGLSLPERVVRGAVGLTAGAVRELAGAVVPQAFQDSASYRIAVTNSLGFLTESIGGVPNRTATTTSSESGVRNVELKGSEEGTEDGHPANPSRSTEAKQGALENPNQSVVAPQVGADAAGTHIAKKAVGNFVDLAGLATLHVSPLWVMAIVSDVCYGSKSFVLELAGELQKQGVIDDTSTIHHVEDILDAVQKGTGTIASTFDVPPFSIAELKGTIAQTTGALSEADVRRLLPEAELRSMWNEMRQVANQENVSLLGVSGAIAMQTLNRVTTVGQGAIIGVQVAGGILNRNVIQHYLDSLSRIQERGFYPTVRDSYGPYVDAVWSNFSKGRSTWTESLLEQLEPSRLRSWFAKGIGLFSSGVSPADSTPTPPESPPPAST